MYFRFMAAMFDLPVTPTWESIRTSPTVFPDPDNMGIAVGISFLSCIEAEIRFVSFLQPPSWISDFRIHPAVFMMVPLTILLLET
jgi:hypothetical protein